MRFEGKKSWMALGCALSVTMACGKAPVLDANHVSKELKSNLLAAANAFDVQANGSNMVAFAEGAEDKDDAKARADDTGLKGTVLGVLSNLSPRLGAAIRYLSTPKAIGNLVNSALVNELLNPNNVDSENAHFAVYNVQRTACDKLRALVESKEEREAMAGTIANCKGFLDRYSVQLRVTAIHDGDYAIGVIVGDRIVGAGVDVVSFTSTKTSFGTRVVLDALAPVLIGPKNAEVAAPDLMPESMTGVIHIETQFTNGMLMPNCPEHMGACTTIDFQKPIAVVFSDGSRFSWSKGEGKEHAAVIAGAPRDLRVELNLGTLDAMYKPKDLTVHGASLKGLFQFNLEDPKRPVVSIKDVKVGTEGAFIKSSEMEATLHLNDDHHGALGSIEANMTSGGVDINLSPLKITLEKRSIKVAGKEEPCLPNEKLVVSTDGKGTTFHFDFSQLGGGASPMLRMKALSDENEDANNKTSPMGNAPTPDDDMAELCMQKRLWGPNIFSMFNVSDSCKEHLGLTLTEGALSVTYHADDDGKKPTDKMLTVATGQCLELTNGAGMFGSLKG